MPITYMTELGINLLFFLITVNLILLGYIFHWIIKRTPNDTAEKTLRVFAQFHDELLKEKREAEEAEQKGETE